MKTIIALLQANAEVSDYKINMHSKESCELFFVKGKLETVRRTRTCDREVTVYVNHGEFKGDSQFFVYPSNTEEQISESIAEAVAKAQLINNKNYELPAAQTGTYTVESNFSDYDMTDLAAKIAAAVSGVNTVEGAALNAVEIFINKHTETIANSRGLEKTQVRYDAMVEAIPTYNGETQSVELYEQYNFGSYDAAEIAAEIGGKLAEVKARYEAVKPDFAIDCPVVLNRQELAGLFMRFARDLNYSSVYSHANLYKKGDRIQKAPTGDRISIDMTGEVKGSIRSAKFDADGMSLGSIRVVNEGEAVGYYGSNRYGQYLGETPTGELPCFCVTPGTAVEMPVTHLEIVSMSGLQVDLNNDYIGGEVRLAYYHDGETMTPLTGISITGKLSTVLDAIRLSADTAVYGSYQGPVKAILTGMTVF